MSYFAGHMKKLKKADLKWAQIHNQRERDSRSNLDIDKSRSHLNYDLANDAKIDYAESINQKIKDGVDRKPKKDATLCNSWVITSDKGFFDRIGEDEEKRFFKEAYQWFCDRYGKENVAFAQVHKDEHTPHMHIGVVPITKDRRLSGKDVFNRAELRAVQDDFPKFIQSKGFDLERGIPSAQKHMEPVRWKNQQLRMEEKRLEKSVGELLTINDKVKPISEMQAEPVTFFGMTFPEKVKVKSEDWEQLKAQAIHVARLRGSVINSERDNESLKGHLKEMGQELQKLRGVAEENEQRKEIEKHVDKLALTLDLIEEELGQEFDLELGEEELEDEEDPRQRKRKARLSKRKRPRGRRFGRHQLALRREKGQRKQEKKRDKQPDRDGLRQR